MINKAILVGRITKDPELKHTGTNIPVAQFTIAINRQFQNAQGEREADFIQCVVWRKQAENLANFIRKGSLIGVEGRLQTRNYQDQNGQTKYITEVVCDNVQFLEPKGDRSSEPRSNKSYGNEPYKQQNNNNSTGTKLCKHSTNYLQCCIHVKLDDLCLNV